MKLFSFSSINLGCAKNLVDTQFLLGKILSNDDFQLDYFADPYDKDVEYVFLNTCGFLSSARQEMIDTITKLLKKKKKIFVFGCAVNYQKIIDQNKQKTDLDMQIQSDEIDALFENKNIKLLSRQDLPKFTLQDLVDGFGSTEFKEFEFIDGPRLYTNSNIGFEYLKIAEGCNNSCAFCLIPKIRGKQKSLDIKEILAQAQNMIKMGIKEIILIAQDTSRYGIDKYQKSALIDLLTQIDKLRGDFRYRLLYLYPDILSLDLIKNFKNLKKFIPYFDIPLQHISPSILKSMQRFADVPKIKDIINYINKSFHPKFLRTNFIVGFPGETQEDFDMLYDFVSQTDFDNIALFEYHDEKYTKAYELPDKVDSKTLHSRFLKLKKLVDKKLEKKQKNRQGQIETGFVENIISMKSGNAKVVIRPAICAPEIDPSDIVYIKNILEVLDKTQEVDLGKIVVYKV